MLERQAMEIKKARALEKVFSRASLSMMVSKTKAFCKWREVVKETQSFLAQTDESAFNVSTH